MLRVATYGKPAPHSFYDVTNTWLIQCRVTNVAPAHRMFATRNEIEFATRNKFPLKFDSLHR